MVVVIAEHFTTNKLAEFTFDQGTKEEGMVVEGGVLKFTDANDHSFHVGFKVSDSFHTMEVTRKGERPTAYLMIKWIDENNFLMLQMDEGSLNLYNRRGGEYHLLLGGAAEFTAETPEWLWLRITGNTIKFGLSTVDPHIEAPKGIEHEVILSGEAAASVGEGKAGEIGLRLARYESGFHANATSVDDWIVEVPSPEVTNPGTKKSQVGSVVKYKVIATHATKYKATGLPAGLAINEATGEITGEPTTVEESMVTLTVEGPYGGEASVEFKWVIEEAAGGANALGMIL